MRDEERIAHALAARLVEHQAPLLAAALAALGSTLAPVVTPRGAWSRLVVERGDRCCEVSDHSVRFADRSMAWRSLDDVARALVRYLDDGATVDDLAADPESALALRDPPA